MSILQKLAGPGLFRLFLASAVFFYHVSRYAFFGSAAVYVFFVLSGYWIQKMWTLRYSRSVRPYSTYLISRAWRLIPTFVLINGIAIITLEALGHPFRGFKGSASWAHFLIPQFLILGYDTLPNKPMVPAWSLDYEMQFYAIAPLLIALIARFSRPWLLLGFAGMTSLTCALLFVDHTLANFLIFFLVGMIAADRKWHPSGKFTFCTVIIALVLLTVCALSPIRGVLFAGEHKGPLSIYNHEVNVLSALLAIPYALYTTRQIGFEIDNLFGDLSYIVYLLHYAALKCLFLYKTLGIPRVVFTLMACAAVYGSAIAIWKFYDHPINKVRAKWVASRLCRSASSDETHGTIAFLSEKNSQAGAL
jgi:peptidoglycan/LPS O-acetylase OafA/YrhL